MITRTNKKYIKAFGPAACLFAVEVADSGEGACEVHYQVCRKFKLAHKPDPRNRYRVGDGLINAGRAIKTAGANFRASIGVS